MERVIKFRAWDKINKKMAIVKRLSFETFVNETIICHEDGKSFACTLVDIELMQFTGLHDKHGVEIYEGDVLLVWTKGDSAGHAYEGVVKWFIDQFVIEFSSSDNFPFNTNLGIWANKSEIKGNVYQHPHLLTSREV